MEKVLLTYDVHEVVDHKKLKADLLKNGWRDIDISDDSTICHLPNTTFLKDNTDVIKERNWFIQFVGGENVVRLMCYRVNHGWAGIIGSAHGPDKT
ncbi:MAG: hypothetical protein ACHQF4_09995 [Sphingobacteriales bacterium]